MATENISLNNADTKQVTFDGQEVCFLHIDGVEVWRKNPSDVPNTFIRRKQNGGDGRGTSNTTIWNPGFGFTSASQVTGFLNGSHFTDNIGLTGTFGEPHRRDIVWRGCTLNSTGGIKTIFASNGTRSDYLSAQSTSVEDDDDEGDTERSWLLGNQGTIFNCFTTYYHSVNGLKVRNAAGFSGTTYAAIHPFFRNRSDVLIIANGVYIDVNRLAQVSPEITGKACGETFAKLSILATESGGYGD